jgi:hypothetical protein
MKLAVLFGLLVFTAFAQAQTCKMKLQNPDGDTIVDLRVGNDPYCSKAYRACRNWYNWYQAPQGSSCVSVSDDGRAAIDYILYPDYDSYYGHQQTIPTPEPTVAVTSDATREIEHGETVFYNGSHYLVVSVNENGFYNLKPQKEDKDKNLVQDVVRPNISITRGCHAGICTHDSVIVVASGTYAAIVGIKYDGTYLTISVDGSETLTADVNAYSLAKTSGCSNDRYRKVCVGNVVMKGRYSTYYNVVGIQADGKLVIEANGTLTMNVRNDELLVVR